MESSERARGETSVSQSDVQTRWTRLRAAFDYAFAPVQPGQEVAPVPRELQEWGTNTALAVLAGMIFYGGKQHRINQQFKGAIAQAGKGAPTKLHAARAVAEQNTQRLLLTSREAVRGAVLCGSAVGGYCGAAQLSAVANGHHNPTVDQPFAGAVTGAVVGALAPTSRSRLLSATLGSAMGALLGYPAGYLENKVRDSLPADDPRREGYVESAVASSSKGADAELLASSQESPRTQYPPLNEDAMQGVISQLEAGLRRPSRNDQR